MTERNDRSWEREREREKVDGGDKGNDNRVNGRRRGKKETKIIERRGMKRENEHFSCIIVMDVSEDETGGTHTHRSFAPRNTDTKEKRSSRVDADDACRVRRIDG